MKRANLTEARLKKCWSQEEAAAAIGIDHITLHRWEAGRSTPRGYNLRKLCEVYGMTAAELGFDDEKKDGNLQISDTNLLTVVPFQQDSAWLDKQQELLSQSPM